eukprot:CAMPEP_0206496230 /NCGR_PEP_ID=MMETSP0324_2-20121206/49227_1 /ASSEMBLY_ACC=CAM_ASM_000836 /TAXON_ID=2866 /ORGANISM="Crypthecodinium cohnii, Strain Seligo" /LENGTH=60 /DNA_ID=CAMNT_0053981091 /DNA_START=33 /DNA_END=215 /DNA_ORIENTATION=+
MPHAEEEYVDRVMRERRSYLGVCVGVWSAYEAHVADMHHQVVGEDCRETMSKNLREFRKI